MKGLLILLAVTALVLLASCGAAESTPTPVCEVPNGVVPVTLPFSTEMKNTRSGNNTPIEVVVDNGQMIVQIEGGEYTLADSMMVAYEGGSANYFLYNCSGQFYWGALDSDTPLPRDTNPVPLP